MKKPRWMDVWLIKLVEVLFLRSYVRCREEETRGTELKEVDLRASGLQKVLVSPIAEDELRLFSLLCQHVPFPQTNHN